MLKLYLFSVFSIFLVVFASEDVGIYEFFKWSPNSYIKLYKDNTGKWQSQIIQNNKPLLESNINVTVDYQVDTIDVKIIEKVHSKLQFGYKYEKTGGFYKLHNPTTWPNARRICKLEGAYLAIPNTEEEAELLASMIPRMPATDSLKTPGSAFIGFHDVFIEGDYETVLGTSLSSSGYLVWVEGQPDNHSNQDCGSITVNKTLDDTYCWYTLPFICEKL